jgi:two-component system cell cycle response regulator DivK
MLCAGPALIEFGRHPGQAVEQQMGPPRMTKRILVIEDQADNRQILSDLLTNEGYQVIEARDGEEGVKAATVERPDLILMDIQLPLLDGYEATRRIKADPALSAIPIIVVTSYSLGGDEAKARAAGCDDFVPKPFSRHQLLAKVREHLPKS